MQSKLNLWEASSSRWGRVGEEPNTFWPKRTSRSEDQLVWQNFQRKGIMWEKKCMPTHKKVLHSGIQSTPAHTVRNPVNLGKLDPLPTEFPSVRQFFFSQQNQINSTYEICLNVLLVPRTKQRLKRRKCVYTTKPIKKTFILNKPGLFHKVSVFASHWCSYSTRSNSSVLALSISIIFFFREFLVLRDLSSPQLLGSFTWLSLGLLCLLNNH